MVVFFNGFVGMTVGSFVLFMDMRMGVNMLMLMRVHQLPMPVLVGMDVDVLMGMLQTDGILHHQHGCRDHNHKANIKLRPRPLAQQKHAKGSTQEWGYGIVGAGFRRPQFFLRLNIKMMLKP